jgi:hypothetical protein
MSSPTHILSVGLWGSDPRYILGFLRLALQVKNSRTFANRLVCYIHPSTFNILFSGNHWAPISRFCCGEATSFFLVKEKANWHSTLWRYSIINTIDNDKTLLQLEDRPVLHFRDLDSIIHPREVRVVSDWMLSNKAYLILKDHPSHDDWPIMAGLFSINTSILTPKETQRIYSTLTKNTPNETLYFSDQIALSVVFQELNSSSIYQYRGHADVETFSAGLSPYIGEPISYSLCPDYVGRAIRAEYLGRGSEC